MSKVMFFEIQASDPTKLKNFYQKVFGWKFTRQEGLPIEYYDIEGAGIRGGLLQRPAKVPPPMHGTNAYVCSVEVNNFDATAKVITDNGAQVALPKFAVPGRCWQGYFVDPDGNTFGIFQVDLKAA
jgi:uncharacterized protein